MKKETPQKDSRDHVSALARGMKVIEAFGPENPRMTVTEMATATGLTRAAARRFLLTLTTQGYARTEGKQFELTPKVLSLGYAYLSSKPFWDIAQPHLEDLSVSVHESCSISVLDGEDIIYVARVPANRIMSVSLGIGVRLPAYCTSMGRVLLSGLTAHELEAYLETAVFAPLTERTQTRPERLREIIDRVKRDGYAIVDQELEDGLRSTAVPLHNRQGRIIAATNISGHTSRVSIEEMRTQYLPHLQRTARTIEAHLP